ncbi:uncharacterized protein [Nicotiana sylvestris]|uniref:Uncharacterized protein LOC104226485 isoform X1 n=1 Tax=Nicotiana sylvestris TaxID=4096 RepID=A0A1U7WRD0_NICSY|nr:PREDICTED: uncharacterized protein LOC104226485 isoform X1 [Nicotiana sylvestris]XP_009776807.1 PREDICTED: uncharacterized protein LOC104226485 isoform X1 [Nicotiana sylvestris]XP_009776812.1 PREDICTED: uncharacterized protein LOC104226485 isoform X1 [Nicotiana sylvestris]
MFASQLLRILQTLPTDSDHGGCVFDTPEETATMKDNQNGILSRSNGYKEANSLLFPTKDFVNSNRYGSYNGSLACDTRDRDELVPELYDSVYFDDISRSKHHEIIAPTVDDDQNEDSHNIITCRRYINPFACNTKYRDQQWSTPEFECSTIADFIDEKENESIVSDEHAPFTSGCKFLGTNTSLYAEKHAKEYELPELIVCYKESNYNIVEEICTDKSVAVMDRILTESWSNGQNGTYVCTPADEDQHSNTSESDDIELCSAGGSKASSVEYANSVAATSEEEDTESLVAATNEEEDTDKVNRISDADTYLEDLIMIFGSKGTTKWKGTNPSGKYSSANIMLHTEESGIQNSQKSNSVGDQSAQQPDQILYEEAALKSQIGVSEKDSSASVMLHLEEPGVRNSQKSSSDCDQSVQQPDQIPFEEAAFKSQIPVSAVVDEANISMAATDLFYGSELGTEAIIFDFNSSKAVTPSSTDEGIENFHEPSVISAATTSYKDRSCYNLSVASQVHYSNSVDKSSSINVHGQSLESQDVANLEDKSSSCLLLDSEGHFADGEASFSALGPASGLHFFSGRISYCGSISLRSDGSTTSTGSFTFPILLSEWNSSPVRMAQVESSHCRKHKRWRQGLLCCRF